MRPVAAAVRAVLHQLEPVRVVTPVLAGDVVAVLALLAGQRDLGPDVSRSHVECLSFLRSDLFIGGVATRRRAPRMRSAPAAPGYSLGAFAWPYVTVRSGGRT